MIPAPESASKPGARMLRAVLISAVFAWACVRLGRYPLSRTTTPAAVAHAVEVPPSNGFVPWTGKNPANWVIEQKSGLAALGGSTAGPWLVNPYHWPFVSAPPTVMTSG